MAGGRCNALSVGGADRRIGAGRIVGRLLGDERFLEDLKRGSNPAYFGGFGLVRNLRRQIAIRQPPHRLQDRANAAPDVAGQIDRRSEAEDDGANENGGHQANRGPISSLGSLPGDFGALVIEFNQTRERCVHGPADGYHLAGIDAFSCRDVALGGKRLHLGRRAGEGFPLACQLICKLPLRGRGDQWLVRFLGLFEIGLAGCEIFVNVRPFCVGDNQMVAQHGAVPSGLHPHLADPSHARQPFRLDILGGGVDRAHLHERKPTDRGDHQKQK